MPIRCRILRRLLKVPQLRFLWSLLKKQVPCEVNILKSLDSNFLKTCNIADNRFKNKEQTKLDTLLKYFQTRPKPKFLLPPRLWGRSLQMMRTNATNLLLGLAQKDAEIPRFRWHPGEYIDWRNNIGKEQFALQRHVFLLDLLYSSAGSLFDRLNYIDCFITEWRRANMGRSNSNRFAWNDDAASNRIQVQIRAMEELIARGHSDQKSVAAFLKCIISHGQWLMDDTNYNFITNHGMMQDCALLEIAITYPEFDRGQAWLKKSVQRMEFRLRRMVSPAGIFRESTPYYHWFATKMALWFIATSKKAGIGLLPSTLTTIQKMTAFCQLILQPDGSLPLISDTKPLTLTSDNWPWDSLPKWTEITNLRNALSHGTQPPNRPDLHIFQNSGYIIMRQAAPHWSRKSALMLTLIAGPKSVCHGHRNKLSITLYARGQSLLQGPGYPGYWDLQTREYLLSTPSQNTVSVDDGSQQDGASHITFHHRWPMGTLDNTDHSVVTFQAMSNLYEGVLHRRSIFYGPETGTILLLDELFSRSEHVYRQHFRSVRQHHLTNFNEGMIRIQIDENERNDHFIIQSTASRDGCEVTPIIHFENGVWAFVVHGRNVYYFTLLKTISTSKSTVSTKNKTIVWSGEHGKFTISLPVESKNRIIWQNSIRR